MPYVGFESTDSASKRSGPTPRTAQSLGLERGGGDFEKIKYAQKGVRDFFHSNLYLHFKTNSRHLQFKATDMTASDGHAVVTHAQLALLGLTCATLCNCVAETLQSTVTRARCHVLTTTNMQMNGFWDASPCSLEGTVSEVRTASVVSSVGTRVQGAASHKASHLHHRTDY